MKQTYFLCGVVIFVGLCYTIGEVDGQLNMFDWRYWKCYLKKTTECPDNEIRFYLYTPEGGKQRMRIDVRNKHALDYAGWDRSRNNVFIVHGYNGTEGKSPMTILRDAFLSRKDYNVFTIDWKPLTQFPCYISSLSNTRLVSKCSAQLYAYIMDHGGSAKKTTCVGHSLGAHICGMISNHLDIKQYRIVALDPARPLIAQYAHDYTRLSPDDAYQVQVIHTNAGRLGEIDQRGTVDFCLNGGIIQPGCKGHKLRIARCSHNQAVCFFAATITGKSSHIGRPCSGVCPKSNSNWGIIPGKSVPMGMETPISARGMYCVDTGYHDACPFNNS